MPANKKTTALASVLVLRAQAKQGGRSCQASASDNAPHNVLMHAMIHSPVGVLLDENA